MSNLAYSVPENESYDFIVNLIETNQISGKQFYYQNTFPSTRGGADFQIGYTIFGSEMGEKGSIVIAPGRTESSMKYIEAAYDFIQAGYSPVFAIDHRGQGFSDRKLTNPHKGHVEKFEYYVDDFSQFLDQVVFSNKNANLKNLYLVSNSMGGAISIRYFQRKKAKNPFKAAFHSGPMLEMTFPDGFNEGKARRLSWFLCASGLTLQSRSCDGYANPTVEGNPGWEDYDPSTRSIDPENPNPENMTHSAARFNFRSYLWDQAYPSIQLGGPTVRWVWQSTKTNQMMRTQFELGKIDIPMLIMTGSEDVRTVIPRHRWYCEQLSKMGKTCEFVEVKGAYHELLVESDQYRIPVMNRLLDFFSQF